MNSTRTKIKFIVCFLTICAVVFGGLELVTVNVNAAVTNAAVGKTTVTTKKTVVATPSPSADPGYALGTLPDNKVYNDFVVGPGKIEIDLNPGESRTIELTIANRLGTEKTFSLTEEDFTGSNDVNNPVVLLGDDRGPYSLKDLIHVPGSSVVVPHAQKAFIPVTISIPANAQPGGLYGSVIVSVSTKQASNESPENASIATNPLVTRLATLFFVRVTGDAKEEGSLTKFQLAGGKTFLLNNQPISFDMIFQNTGDVFLVPQGQISVNNMLGSSVGAITVDPWFALPQSLRFREVSWAPPFLFGRYTAHAVIRRGYGSTTDEMDLVFWVIPWKIILAIFIGLILIILGLRWIITHFKFVGKKGPSQSDSR